jgi:hypothetical protein
MIQPGQIYRSCDPRESIRIRITAYRPGDARAHVVDAVTGKRPRQIFVKDLHESPVTATGRRRRSGYVLDRDTPEAPQEATEGRQSALEGASGQRETPRGRNEAQVGAESFGGEPQPRGPVDWARQQAAEREQRPDPDAVIRAAKFTAAHWHQAALDRDDIPMAHAIACIRAALAGEARPDQLGLDEDVHDAFRAALGRPPAHNAGPSVAEAAANDRLWPLQKHGE